MQTILYHGQTISVTRFEALSGREVAKKWKQSLYSVGPDGEPEQVRPGPSMDWVMGLGLMGVGLVGVKLTSVGLVGWSGWGQAGVADGCRFVLLARGLAGPVW